MCIPAILGQAVGLSEIPQPVIDQFSLYYPDAESIEWTAQNNKFLAQFKNNKMYTSALLRKDGKMLQTETQIRVIALPVEATAYLQESVKAKKIESAAIMENEFGEITFKAFADKSEYWFDGDGNLFQGTDIAAAPRSQQ